MGKKILIIDDNEQDRKIIQRFLTKAGYDASVTAATGEEGLEKAASEKPDLVVIDTMLPGINGFEVCRRIRQTHGESEPKTVIITGQVDAVDAVEARRSGANDYCAKTRDYGPLIEAVQKLI
jgi:DNA-binding response OmpR family regulator